LAAVEISHATRDGDRIRGETPGSAGNRTREFVEAGARFLEFGNSGEDPGGGEQQGSEFAEASDGSWSSATQGKTPEAAGDKAGSSRMRAMG
jgi:hypothetical protein